MTAHLIFYEPVSFVRLTRFLIEPCYKIYPYFVKFVFFSCWSSLLQVCEEKANEKANDWWFHVYYVIQRYFKCDDNTCSDVKKLADTLQQFMESSSLGEFSARLKILFSFYCQLTIDQGLRNNSGDLFFFLT